MADHCKGIGRDALRLILGDRQTIRPFDPPAGGCQRRGLIPPRAPAPARFAGSEWLRIEKAKKRQNLERTEARRPHATGVRRSRPDAVDLLPPRKMSLRFVFPA